MTKTVIGAAATNAPRSQRRYMQVVLEIEMDNTAAMFNRFNFDNRIAKAVQEFNATAKLGGPIVHATTEDVE